MADQLRLVRTRGTALLVTQSYAVPNTEPIGDEFIQKHNIIARIDETTIDALALKALYFGEPICRFYDEFCDEQGYYGETREWVRDLVWQRHDELRKSKS